MKMFLYTLVLVLLCATRSEAAAINSQTTFHCPAADDASIDRCAQPFWRSMPAVSSLTLSIVQAFSYQVSLFEQFASFPSVLDGDATDGDGMLATKLKGLNVIGKDSGSMDDNLASVRDKRSKTSQVDTNSLHASDQKKAVSQNNEIDPGLDFDQLFGYVSNLIQNSDKRVSDQEVDKLNLEIAKMPRDLNKISNEIKAVSNLLGGRGKLRDADDPDDSTNVIAIVCRAYERFQDCTRAVGILERCRDNRMMFVLRAVYGFVCGEGKQALESAQKTCFRGEMTMVELMRAGSQSNQADTFDSVASGVATCMLYFGNMMKTSADQMSTAEAGSRCICREINKQLNALAAGAQIKCGKSGHDFFEGYRVNVMGQISSTYPYLANCDSVSTADEGQPQSMDLSVVLTTYMRMLQRMKPTIAYIRTFVSRLGQQLGPCHSQTLQLKAILCLIDYLVAVQVPSPPFSMDVLGNSLCSSKQHFLQCLDTELTDCTKHDGVNYYRDIIVDACAMHNQSAHCPMLTEQMFQENFASLFELKCGNTMAFFGGMSLNNKDMIAAKQIFDKVAKYSLCSLDVMRPYVKQIRKACGDTAADSLAKYIEDMTKDIPVLFEELNAMFGDALTWLSILQGMGPPAHFQNDTTMG